jgi:hypothetical protein
LYWRRRKKKEEEYKCREFLSLMDCTTSSFFLNSGQVVSLKVLPQEAVTSSEMCLEL